MYVPLLYTSLFLLLSSYRRAGKFRCILLYSGGGTEIGWREKLRSVHVQRSRIGRAKAPLAPSVLLPLPLYFCF